MGWGGEALDRTLIWVSESLGVGVDLEMERNSMKCQCSQGMGENNPREVVGVWPEYISLKEIRDFKEGGVRDGLKVPGVRLVTSRFRYTWVGENK